MALHFKFNAEENNFITFTHHMGFPMKSVIFDASGNGPVHVALNINNEELIEYFFSQNRRVIDQQNFAGETPLLIAIAEMKYNLAIKLIKLGANVNIANKSGTTPLHLAVRVPEIVKILIDNGVDMNSVDEFGQTALHAAAYFGYLETVCMLLYYNAEANVKDLYNVTPFMLAIQNQDHHIQEVLFEYVEEYNVITSDDDYDDDDDYDYKFISLLGLALIYNSPFVEEIINRGADVNNVNGQANGAYFLALHYSRVKSSVKLKHFKLVWEKLNYDPYDSEMSILGSLFMLDANLFHEIVDIFMESNNFQAVVDSVIHAGDLNTFLVRCLHHELPQEKISGFFCKLLCYGYTPNEFDMSLIYHNFGYCELFKIMLHMDIRRNKCDSDVNKIPTRLIYDIEYDRRELFLRLVETIQNGTLPQDDLLGLTVFRILDNFNYRPLMESYVKMGKTDCVSLKIGGLPKVPSLLELARNKTRDHIQRRYYITDSYQMYTVIENLDIANVYKKILTFETVIYKPSFTEVDFRRYIKLLKMTPIRKQALDPIIRDALKNCVVK